MTITRLFAISFGLLLFSVTLGLADNWPQWRGPDRSGRAGESNLPTTWDGKTKTDVLWRVPADFGHSCPIVWGDRVFLSASVRKTPRAKEQLAENQQHRIVCFNTADGSKIWQTDVEAGSWDTEFSFTASTPATDGKRIFALFGSGALAAVDVEGKLLWQKKLPGAFKAEWLSSSPILFQDTLFVFVDVSNDSWMLAMDAATGDVKWDLRRKQGDKVHNSSPLLVMVREQPRLVVAAQGGVVAIDPRSGKEIWTCKWSGNRYASLTAGGGLLYVTGEGSEGLAIDPSGEGDVAKTHVKWRHARDPQGIGSPAIAGEYLYRASPPGVLRCWKMSNGELVYEEKVPGIPTFSSPIVTASGALYFASAGKSCVVKGGPTFELLATNDMGEGEKNEWTLSGPSAAVADGKIFLRGPKSLVCIGKK